MLIRTGNRFERLIRGCAAANSSPLGSASGSPVPTLEATIRPAQRSQLHDRQESHPWLVLQCGNAAFQVPHPLVELLHIRCDYAESLCHSLLRICPTETEAGPS
jgi:hypothetical protein